MSEGNVVGEGVCLICNGLGVIQESSNRRHTNFPSRTQELVAYGIDEDRAEKYLTRLYAKQETYLVKCNCKKRKAA